MARIVAVTPSDLGGRLDPYGRLRLAKLMEEHGDDLGLPELAVRLASGCAKADALNPAERCFVFFPQLGELDAS